AQKMGLCITQEHFAPLGVALREVLKANPTMDASFRRNRAKFVELWEASIQRYPRPENVVWTVGLRGAGDHPFWFDDRERDTDDEHRRKPDPRRPAGPPDRRKRQRVLSRVDVRHVRPGPRAVRPAGANPEGAPPRDAEGSDGVSSRERRPHTRTGARGAGC